MSLSSWWSSAKNSMSEAGKVLENKMSNIGNTSGNTVDHAVKSDKGMKKAAHQLIAGETDEEKRRREANETERRSRRQSGTGVRTFFIINNHFLNCLQLQVACHCSVKFGQLLYLRPSRIFSVVKCRV